MPDWKSEIRARMERLNLAPEAKEEVIAELAAHFEEIHDSAVCAGKNSSEAIQLALQEVSDWNVLSADIRRAKSLEDNMNRITKRFLLPAIAFLFAIGLTLLFLDRAAVVQRVIWTAEMGLLLCLAVYEHDRFNQRTKSVWLPGFVSLTAASLFLFAEETVLAHDPSFYFTDMSLRPDHLTSLRWFYFAWLLAQTFCGAAAAYFSRRAGGSLSARIVAAAFPAIIMFGLWTLLIPVSTLVEHNTFLWKHPLVYLLGVFIWVVPPAIALVAGAAPFLRDVRPVEA